MEEDKDIKILEDIIQTYKDWNELPYKFNKEIIQAIQNLIARYKELEKANKIYVKIVRSWRERIKEIIYPSPENPIELEIQNSKMYKELEKLVED